nr:hypothetical protein 1634Bnrm2_p109 [Cryptomonas sp.]
MKRSIPKYLIPENIKKKYFSEKKKGILFLSNISFKVCYGEIKHFFGRFGNIYRIFLINSKNLKNIIQSRKKNSVVGWIEFFDKKNAKQASEYFNKNNLGSNFLRKVSVKYLRNFDWKELCNFFLK